MQLTRVLCKVKFFIFYFFVVVLFESAESDIEREREKLCGFSRNLFSYSRCTYWLIAYSTKTASSLWFFLLHLPFHANIFSVFFSFSPPQSRARHTTQNSVFWLPTAFHRTFPSTPARLILKPEKNPTWAKKKMFFIDSKRRETYAMHSTRGSAKD